MVAVKKFCDVLKHQMTVTASTRIIKAVTDCLHEMWRISEKENEL